MRRVLTTVLPAAALVLAVPLAAGCGIASDDTAATVGDQVVSVSTVDQLVTDESFVTSAFQAQPPDESVVPGDLARSTLAFEIQSAALRGELDRVGIELSDEDLAAGREQATQQLSGSPSDETVEAVARYFAAATALQEWLSGLDPGSEEDRRAVYEGVPAYWNRTCVAVAVVPGDAVEDAEAVLADGEVEDLAREVEGAELVAEADADGCTVTAQFPQELQEALADSTTGATGGPVTIPGPQGDLAVYWRVDGAESLTLEEADTQLTELVEGLAGAEQALGTWLGLVLLDGVEVNPRYGTPAVSARGQFEVAAPAGPLVITPSTTLLPSGGTPTEPAPAP
jgi:hypothetical protein